MAHYHFLIWKSFSVALDFVTRFYFRFSLYHLTSFDSRMMCLLVFIRLFHLSVLSVAIYSRRGGIEHQRKKNSWCMKGPFSDIWTNYGLFYFLIEAETKSTQLIIFDVVSNIAITVSSIIVDQFIYWC